ncbi:MAG: hypothetical protein ABW224_10355 [Kibdelosporangium sp.]
MSRTGIAAVLALLGCLLAGLAVAAYSLNHEIADQDRYVRAVTPVADDPLVRQELAARVSDTISAKLAPGNLQLPAAARELVGDVVTKVVESDGFRTAWVAVNKAAQPEVVAMLRGDPSSLSIADDTVLLDVGAVVDQAKARLIADGVPFARQLPDIDASVKLFSRPAIRKAVPAFGVLQDLSVVLPVVALALLAAALLISARRARTLVVIGAGLAVVMLLVVLYQWISRDQLTSASPSPHMAGAFYDALTGDLRTLVWVVFGIGVLAAVFGFFFRRGTARDQPPSRTPATGAPGSRW